MLMKEAAAKQEAVSQSHPPPGGEVAHSFAAARRAILQADARRMPVLTSSKTGPLWTAPATSPDWEQSTMT